MKHLLVVGSLNMDLVIQVEKIPAVGETVLGRELRYSPGGKGANQACAAGRLGGCVEMLGCVGDDGFGRTLVESLERAGVGAGRIGRVSGSATGTAVISVDRAGANSIIVAAGANSCCSRAYLEEHDSLFGWCDILLLQMEIPGEAAYYAVERAAELGKTVILNPAPAPGELPPHILRRAAYLTPNETELAAIGGCGCATVEEARRGAERLARAGGAKVLVTLGEQGALLADSAGSRLFPGFPAEAVDTTAAGDCFNAAFAVALGEGRTDSEAIAFANAAGALSVQRSGAQASLPFRDEVEAFLKTCS